MGDRCQLRHRFVQNTEASYGPLKLDGRDDMKLTALKLNGETLPGSAYELTDDTLTIHSPPKSDFEIECTTEIRPDQNTLLEGLYMSQGIYCTQCARCWPSRCSARS